MKNMTTYMQDTDLEDMYLYVIDASAQLKEALNKRGYYKEPYSSYGDDVLTKCVGKCLDKLDTELSWLKSQGIKRL